MATKVPLVLGTYRVPITVKTAVKEEKESELNMVCAGPDPEHVQPGDDKLEAHAPVRINQVIKCPTCTRTGPQNIWPRGRDNGDSTFTILTAEQIAEAKGVSRDVTHSLNITTHPAEQVESGTVESGKFYWLAADKGFEKDYALFVKIVEAHDDLAFCTVWAYRSAPAMYRLVVRQGVLGITQLAWPAEVEAPPANNGVADERFLPIAEQLVEILKDDFDAATFADTRRANILAALTAAQSVHAGEAPEFAAAAPEGDVSGLLAALEAAAAAKGLTLVKDKPKAGRKAKVNPKAAPPKQPLPDVLPDNVVVVTPAKAPKKRKSA